MPDRVFITGGSGFVGSAIVDELLQRHYAINVLVNRHDLRSNVGTIKSFKGGLFDAGAIDRAIAGCNAVIHVVGIIMEKPAQGITFERLHFEATRNVVDAAVRAGVRRYIQMSALGVRPDAASRYHQTKYKAEEYVRQSGLDWTIFRPSLIHGPAGEFMKMESRWVRKVAPPFLFMPYFGAGIFGQKGAGLLQPVYVGDVARAFVDALANPKTIGEVYPLGGAQQVTWPQLHNISAQAIRGKKRWVLPLPAWYARVLTYLMPGALLPFSRDQVTMSQEDNTADLTKFIHDFGWTPRPFAQALASYATELRQ